MVPPCLLPCGRPAPDRLRDARGTLSAPPGARDTARAPGDSRLAARRCAVPPGRSCYSERAMDQDHPRSAVARRRLNRRAALARFATAGAAVAALSASGLEWLRADARQATPPGQPALKFAAGEDLVEPPVRSSKNGRLDTT